MIAVTAAVSIGVFIFGLRFFGVFRVAGNVLVTAQGAVAVLRDKSLDDSTREKKLQRTALQLFGTFISILIRSMLSLLSSLVPSWIASFMGLLEVEDVISYLSRWDVIAIATVVMVAGYFIWKRLRPSSKTAFSGPNPSAGSITAGRCSGENVPRKAGCGSSTRSERSASVGRRLGPTSRSCA